MTSADDGGRARTHVVAAAARVDAAVAIAADVSRNEARRLIDSGHARVNGRRAKKGDRVAPGDVVDVVVLAWTQDHAALAAVVYVDERIVVIDKPAGMPSHPLQRGEGGTALDVVAARFPEVATGTREGLLVHRLDTGTSGLLAFARTPAERSRLRRAFQRGAAGKAYLALVEGRVVDELVVQGAIVHDATDPRRMIVAGAGRGRGAPREARTRAVAVTASDTASLVVVAADRGRRHQVRVHLAAAGHPLVGDVLYGAAPADDVPFHALHAAALALPGHAVVVVAPPAPFMAAAAARGLRGTPATLVDRARALVDGAPAGGDAT